MNDSVKKIYVLKVGETVVYENRWDSNQIQCVNVDRIFGSKNNIKQKKLHFLGALEEELLIF